MKAIKKPAGIGLVAILALSGLLLFYSPAAAAEDPGQWRPIYDMAMRWLNFGIIVFILVKFAREPVTSFLQNRRKEVQREIDALEEKKEAIEAQIQEALKILDESEIRFAAIKERIIKDGQRKKQKIIEDAERESQILLASTKNKIANKIAEAREAFREELVDMAISIAMQKLPQQITTEDNRKFTDRYLAGIAAK